MKRNAQTGTQVNEIQNMFHVSCFMFHGSRGQALVEAIVAISVVVVGFGGIATLLARSLSLNRVVSEDYIGTYLAAEGIELTKNLIDANIFRSSAWDCGINNGNFEVNWDSVPPGASCPGNALQPVGSGSVLHYDPVTHRYSHTATAGSLPSKYTRVITITKFGTPAEEIQVSSAVTWTTLGGANFTVNLEDHFLNWRP